VESERSTSFWKLVVFAVLISDNKVKLFNHSLLDISL